MPENFFKDALPINYKLTIQYDGTNYAGWQIQQNAITVQQLISEAIQTITKQKINLIGSGRTDAGVHAFGQIANFTIDHKLDLYKFKYSLNSILPEDISVCDISEVGESFNARFDAKSRSYLYVISKIKSPFYYKYSYFIKRKLDLNKLKKISKNFIGEKDFTSFCKKNSDVENKNCNVINLEWKESKNFYLMFIEANRFLHGMVRTVAGTILNAEEHSFDQYYLKKIIDAKNREEAGEAVPAKGLFLYKVKY